MGWFGAEHSVPFVPGLVWWAVGPGKCEGLCWARFGGFVIWYLLRLALSEPWLS